MTCIGRIGRAGLFGGAQRYVSHAQLAGPAFSDVAAIVVDELDRSAATLRGTFEQGAVRDRNEIGRQRSGGQSDEKLGTDPRRLTCGDGQPG